MISTNLRHFCLLSVLLLIPVRHFAQAKQGKALADSLYAALPGMASDTNKVKALVKLSKSLYSTDPAKGIQYGQEAIQLAQKLKWAKGEATAQIAKGANYEQRSDLVNALKCYFAALKQYEQINEKRGIASANWGIGNIYNVQKNYDRSLEYQAKALTTYRQLGDKHGEASLLGNMANNYMMSGRYDKARELYLRALAMDKETGDPTAIATELHNIGSIYFKSADYLSALKYYDEARRIINADNAPILLGRTLGNMGSCYLKIVIDSVADITDSLVPQTREATLDLGITYILQSVALSSKLGDMEQLYNCYNDLAEAFNYKHDYQKANEYLVKKYEYRDSVFSTDKSSIISQLEAQQAADEMHLKEKDMQILKLRSQVYIISIILLVFIIAIGVVRISRQRKTNRQLSAEKERHLERIDSQNKILEHIAHIQSHNLRASVTNILGLARLFNTEHPEDPHNAEIIDNILQAASKMDKDIIEVVSRENKLRKEKG